MLLLKYLRTGFESNDQWAIQLQINSYIKDVFSSPGRNLLSAFHHIIILSSFIYSRFKSL